MKLTKLLSFVFLYQSFCVLAQAQPSLSCSYILKPIFIDFHSKWGVAFLPSDDPAWKDPEYLDTLAQYAAPDHINYGGRGRFVEDDLMRQFNKLGADGKIIGMTGSGTAANNLLFEMIHSHQALYDHPKKHLRPRFIRIGPGYLGTNGAIRSGGAPAIPSEITPVVHPNKILNKKEIKEIEDREEKALQYIEKTVKESDDNFAAIFLELVSTSHGSGLITYRKEFLLKLKKLSTKLNILILIDEIMSGGGRTGKFWAYQHFEGFTPDLVTFGKGLVINGVFKPHESRYKGHSALGGVTSSFNILALIQATQVLREIRSRNLIQNAEEMGQYLLKVILELNSDQKNTDYSPEVRGLGLMLTARIPWDNKKYNMGYGSRLLPPLTISKYEIDNLFEKTSD